MLALCLLPFASPWAPIGPRVGLAFEAFGAADITAVAAAEAVLAVVLALSRRLLVGLVNQSFDALHVYPRHEEPLGR